jgi:ABC-type transporter Mla MlaB component
VRRKFGCNMWKLEKSQNGGSLIFALCGRLEQGQLPELQKILEAESEKQNVVLDLKELKLVDQAVVMFFAQCESSGIRLENCPAYIREWIRRE